MGSFFEPQTKIIEIDEENTVTIRKPTFGEMMDVMETSGIKAGGSNEEYAAKLGRALTRLCIVEWAGSGFDGAEPTPDNVDRLPFAVGTKIIEIGTPFMMASIDEGKA